jgi:hypothetical protein
MTIRSSLARPRLTVVPGMVSVKSVVIAVPSGGGCLAW